MKKKRIIIASIVLLSVFTTFSLIAIGNYKQDKKISISLTEQEWNMVLLGLGKLPLENSQNIYMSIIQQANQQLQAQQKPIIKDTITKKKQ